MSEYVQIQTYATCNQQTLQEVLQRYQNVIAQLGCNDPQALAWILQIEWPTFEDDILGDIYAAPFQLTPDQKQSIDCVGISISLYTRLAVPRVEEPVAWVAFNLLFDAESLRKELTSAYTKEAGSIIWLIMCELAKSFREIGVYFTDSWQDNLSWRALSEDVGDPWSFDLAIFPRTQAEHFAVVPPGFHGTIVERDFGFAQENRWITLPWQTDNSQ
jgi:hypothetical protein